MPKLAKSSSYYFSDKSFFSLLNYHNDSSTIPVAFIIKFWSTITEMISSGTMKEESLKDCRDLISKLDAIFISVFIN